MVFNTGMTGYQETLTDPSYCRQIVAMTAPHIGNTGINDEDAESRRIWVTGYVVREPARLTSNWRARRSLDDELAAQGVAGIAIIGTRALTRHLRERGAMRAGISTAETDPAALLERVLASPRMTGADLAARSAPAEPYVVRPPEGTPVRFRVAAVDLGIKASTPRYLAGLGCEVHVLPATATADEILAASPDGVFFANGPGDPAAPDYAVEAMRGVLDAGPAGVRHLLRQPDPRPGARLGTYKLRFGHRGVNQPVQDLRTGRVEITSHNHGFAVDDAPRDGASFDTAVRRRRGHPRQPQRRRGRGPAAARRAAFAVQYHPEAAPGPHDATGLFDRFCDLMEGRLSRCLSAPT